ncbi:MAG: restriction endonuclease subunit S, partial [Anaerolineae bacterium]|nr:restriction endonuclease subunit S [Anaerolineae bacterium]
MSEWQEFILEDAVERFIDYRGKTPPKTDSGIPLVTAKIVKNGAIQTPSEFISEETYDQWMTRGFPKENDVVLTTEAPLGEVALLKDENVALAQRIILMRGKPHVLNNGFLKYYFQSREGQHLLQSRASGTTVFGIKAAVLKKIPIPVPPLPEQKAISAVLSSLDDKIDLLHRQNKTLEALAQTLFRHWFIDGAEDDWEEYQLGEFVEVTRGLSYKGAGLTEEGSGIPMHNLNSVYRGGGYKYEGIKFYAGEYKLKHLVKPRDIIVVNTDLTQDLALIGCPAIVPMSYGSEGLFSHHLYRLEITDARISQQFLYYLLLSYGVREQLTGATNGTTVTMLPKDGIEWAVFSLPQQSLIRRFSEMAQQYWDKKEANYA